MKNLILRVGSLVLVVFTFCLLSSTALAQRGNNCNVQQAQQQTSAAAAIERAQITSALQPQQFVVQSQGGGGTTASASATSGSANSAPSVAALRAAGGQVIVQQAMPAITTYTQSVPVITTQSVPVTVQSIPSDNVVLLASNGGSRSRSHLFGNLGNRSTSKSVAITRTSTR